MPGSPDPLDRYFLEMRMRCLSLAADLDRIERSPKGADRLKTDPRIAKLRQALAVLLDGHTNRAEQVLTIFSDQTPPPPHGPSAKPQSNAQPPSKSQPKP